VFVDLDHDPDAGAAAQDVHGVALEDGCAEEPFVLAAPIKFEEPDCQQSALPFPFPSLRGLCFPLVGVITEEALGYGRDNREVWPFALERFILLPFPPQRNVLCTGRKEAATVKVTKSRRVLAVLAVLAPVVPLALVTVGSAQAESGYRMCARYSDSGSNPVTRTIRAVKLPKDNKRQCEAFGSTLDQGLTNPIFWWDTCEDFAALIQQTGDPCPGLKAYPPPPGSPPLEEYVHTYTVKLNS
jgi:hypothetical protein